MTNWSEELILPGTRRRLVPSAQRVFREGEFGDDLAADGVLLDEPLIRS